MNTFIEYCKAGREPPPHGEGRQLLQPCVFYFLFSDFVSFSSLACSFQ